MKKICVMAAAIAMLAFPAFAQETKTTVLGANPYVGLNAGLGFQQNRDAAFNGGVAGGLNWTNFRSEIAYDGSFQGGNAGYNLGNVTLNSFMWKNYIQAPVKLAGRTWEPYAMAGLGVGLFSGSGVVASSDLMYTLGAGVRTGVGQGFTVGLGYEYVMSNNTDVIKPGGTDFYRSNNVTVRVTKQF